MDICTRDQAQYLLRHKNIVYRDDIDVLDAFGFEVIISSDIAGDLRIASSSERSRNAELWVMFELKAVAIYNSKWHTIRFFPLRSRLLASLAAFSFKHEVGGMIAPGCIWECAKREAATEWAAFAEAVNMEAILCEWNWCWKKRQIALYSSILNAWCHSQGTCAHPTADSQLSTSRWCPLTMLHAVVCYDTTSQWVDYIDW